MNFEILIFGSSSGTPIAPYALVDVSWMVFDGFRARVALARLLDTFSADFQSISLQIPLQEIWNKFENSNSWVGSLIRLETHFSAQGIE